MQQFAQEMTWDQTRPAVKETAASRDERFTALVRQHSAFIFQVAYTVLRNVQDAEDAVQEVFLKLCRRQDRVQMEEERAYLARAAWRTALNRRRLQTIASPPIPDAPSPGKKP